MYREPYAKRHYANLLSSAVFYRLVAPILAIIVSFVIALTTGDMWIKNSEFLEQPLVKFGYDLVLVLEVRNRSKELESLSLKAQAVQLSAALFLVYLS